MRLIVTLLLMTVTAPAWAEWVKYYENEKKVLYYDPTTIKKQGNLRRVWTIDDYKERQPYNYKEAQSNHFSVSSSRALWEYDCYEGRGRLLSISNHSGQMAGGETLGTLNTSLAPWEGYYPPETVGATMLKIVCK